MPKLLEGALIYRATTGGGLAQHRIIGNNPLQPPLHYPQLWWNMRVSHVAACFHRRYCLSITARESMIASKDVAEKNNVST